MTMCKLPQSLQDKKHYTVAKCNADYYTCILLFLVLLDFSLWLVNGGMLTHFVGMKCSSLHNRAPIDSIFGDPAPSNLYPLELGQWRRTPSSQRGGPTPSSLPKNANSGPERRPTPFSSSIVYIPLGCRFCFLDTPGIHGLKY